MMWRVKVVRALLGLRVSGRLVLISRERRRRVRCRGIVGIIIIILFDCCDCAWSWVVHKQSGLGNWVECIYLWLLVFDTVSGLID